MNDTEQQCINSYLIFISWYCYSNFTERETNTYKCKVTRLRSRSYWMECQDSTRHSSSGAHLFTPCNSIFPCLPRKVDQFLTGITFTFAVMYLCPVLSVSDASCTLNASDPLATMCYFWYSPQWTAVLVAVFPDHCPVVLNISFHCFGC